MSSARVRSALAAVALFALQRSPTAWADAAAPAGDDAAADAAIVGAVASARAGDRAAAVAAYERFVATFGSEPALTALERTDRPRLAARVRLLRGAYDALRAAHRSVLDDRGEVAIEVAIANQRRFSTPERRAAARNAVLLYAAEGDERGARAAGAVFARLDPSPDERAEVEFVLATAACGGTGTPDPSRRVGCERAMTTFHDRNRHSAPAARQVVRAAYTIAKAMQADPDPRAGEWCRHTVDAFERYSARAPSAVGSFEADLAAECAFSEIDARLQADFDYETGHHRYAGKPDAVLKTFDADLARASATYAKDLERIARFGSQTWTAAALAREASLYDSCRTGLYNTSPPDLQIYPPQNGFLNCWGSFASTPADHAARVRWRDARNAKLEVADAPMIRLYTRALLAARAPGSRSASVDHALSRLAFFGDILGDERIRAFTRGLPDPATGRAFDYVDGMFLRARRGQSLTIDVDPLPPPARLRP